MENDLNAFLFIYRKGREIRVLSLRQAANDKALKEDGWVLVNTLDPCQWLEHLYNDCNKHQALEQIIELGKQP